MILRSLLYVPADNGRFIDKAHLRGADGIILDLEDSVSPNNKVAARDRLSASIASVSQNGAKVFVRVNVDMGAALEDANAALLGGAFGVYVPKASVDRLVRIDESLATKAGGSLALVALIETPDGLLQAREIARQNHVIAMCVGGEDLANELGAQPDPDVLKLPKQMVHYAAKSRGLLSFGTFRSVADFTDLDAIKFAAIEAKRFGFDGASCVHPDVVPVLNSAFQPTHAEIQWAQNVVNEADRRDGSAFSLNGKMIDAPVLQRARRLLAQAQK